jgi:orotate phosphoribosyltransferase
LEWERNRLLLVRDLGRILVKTGAIQFGTFTLASGNLSSYYIDLRVVPSFPDVFDRTVSAFIGTIKNSIGVKKIEAIGGVPTSGHTYATAVAYSIKKPLIYVREEEKKYGTPKKIEGILKPGSKLLVLDDLITSGLSLIKTIDIIRSEGGVVTDATVLIDRMEGGRESLAKKGVRLSALTNIEELTNLLYEMDILDSEQINSIRLQMKK